MTNLRIPDDVARGLKDKFGTGIYHTPIDWVRVLNVVTQYYREKKSFDEKTAMLLEKMQQMDQARKRFESMPEAEFIKELMTKCDVLSEENKRLRDTLGDIGRMAK